MAAPLGLSWAARSAVLELRLFLARGQVWFAWHYYLNQPTLNWAALLTDDELAILAAIPQPGPPIGPPPVVRRQALPVAPVAMRAPGDDLSDGREAAVSAPGATERPERLFSPVPRPSKPRQGSLFEFEEAA